MPPPLGGSAKRRQASEEVVGVIDVVGIADRAADPPGLDIVLLEDLVIRVHG